MEVAAFESCLPVVPQGFNAPSILFLSTWDGPERAYYKGLLAKALAAGYTRYVEPCTGAFVMPLVAREAGYTTAVMEGSDTSLFTSVLGCLVSGQPLVELDVSVDGQPVALEGDDPVGHAAQLLYAQLLARLQAKPDVDYWHEMVTDLNERRDDHVEAIAVDCRDVLNRLEGMAYTIRPMWEHFEEAAEDPRAVVVCNPPTYRLGYEKFFDTKGRLTWHQPNYEPFDPAHDHTRIQDIFAGKPALLLCQQQVAPGKAAHHQPVYGRHLSPGQYVYVHSNRPEEVWSLTGGPVVQPRKLTDICPLDRPTVPMDYQVRPDSQVVVQPIEGKVATYYKNLWLHRILGKQAGCNYAVIVDGMVAGVGGYSLVIRPYPGAEKWRDAAIMVYALGAPHKDRLTRLITILALRKGTFLGAFGPSSSIHSALVERLITVEYTRHPEAKGLRGLMKLDDRQEHPDGWKLVYVAPLTELSTEEALAKWLKDEASWRRSRAKAKGDEAA